MDFYTLFLNQAEPKFELNFCCHFPISIVTTAGSPQRYVPTTVSS